MATIWERFKDQRLRSKLAWSYTVVFTMLFAIAFSSIYIISERYRKEEFYQRLKDRTLTTYKLMVEVDQINYDMLKLFDRNTINSLYDEKILLFDSSLKLIYSSIDDTYISYPDRLLQQLKDEDHEEIELTEGKYQLIGIRSRYKGSIYYGIAKAYDRFGQNKIRFLRDSLIIIFLLVVSVLLLLSLYLSKIITQPVTELTTQIASISTDKLSFRIPKTNSNDEVALLTNKFNELLDKVEDAFKFQYHFIHHISHELKTPLAVMIANAEAALGEQDEESLVKSINFIKYSLMEMSHVINAMLDISKTEQRLATIQEHIRLDELLFECIDDLSYANSNVAFDFGMDGSIEQSEKLMISGNSRMLKMAFINLLKNAANYADAERPEVVLSSEGDKIAISITNDGPPIPEKEREKIFTHFFRGENSKHVKGFGLGLVLVHRIIALHNGTIRYSTTATHNNQFTVTFPVA